MKKISTLIITLAVYTSSYSQSADEISIDLNLVRFARTLGLFGVDHYRNEFTYLNGFSISYTPAKNLRYFVGLRRVNTTIDSGDGFTYETADINGLEFRAGVKFSSKRDKRVFLTYGLELFGEFSTLQGTYWVDYPPTYEINHKKNYIGFAPSLEIGIRVIDNIILFAETRYRFGVVDLIQIESTQMDKELFENRSYWLNLYEPLNAIGVRFNL